MDNDQLRVARLNRLKLLVSSPGYQEDLLPRIDSMMREGWEEFIKLPVERKTSKVAFNYQAQYQVLKNLKTWIKTEIEMGEEADRVLRRKSS